VLLAHSLGLEVIGEGVETPGQRDRLRDFGCDSVQGFLVSHPLSAEAAGELIASRRAAAALPEPGREPRITARPVG